MQAENKTNGEKNYGRKEHIIQMRPHPFGTDGNMGRHQKNL